MARAVVVVAMAAETAMVEAAVVMAVALVVAAQVALAVAAVGVLAGQAARAVGLLVVNFGRLGLHSPPTQGALAAPFLWRHLCF